MVKHLGQITDEIIDNWAKEYEQRADGFHCRNCGSQIGQVTCHVSIHIKEFEPTCAGPGKVVPINFPFCPKCDGDIEYATACYHIPLWRSYVVLPGSNFICIPVKGGQK